MCHLSMNILAVNLNPTLQGTLSLAEIYQFIYSNVIHNIIYMRRNQLNVTNGIQIATFSCICSDCFSIKKNLQYFFMYYNAYLHKKKYENKYTNTIYTNPLIHLSGNQKKVKQLLHKFVGDTTAFFITTKRCTSKSRFSNQLLKLYRECCISFYDESVQSDKK